MKVCEKRQGILKFPLRLKDYLQMQKVPKNRMDLNRGRGCMGQERALFT